MTAATIVENITREWKKISDGQCEVQSINDRSTFDKLQFDFYIGEEMPARLYLVKCQRVNFF